MTSSKKCFKCESVKPLTEFYKHKKMADGHLNKCKTCTKSDVTKHRDENIDRIRKYDRQRAKLAHRIKLRTDVNRAWRAEDTRRQTAHNAVRRAIIKGSIIKSPCVKCGNEKSLAHHEDYGKPLDIVWLCQVCHKKRHKEMKAIF